MMIIRMKDLGDGVEGLGPAVRYKVQGTRYEVRLAHGTGFMTYQVLRGLRG